MLESLKSWTSEMIYSGGRRGGRNGQGIQVTDSNLFQSVHQ